jgi:hypothetical protein
MQQPAQTALFQAATSTFESLALLFPEPASADGAVFLPLAAIVSVTHRGAASGRVVVGVTAGVLPEVSGNMLGAAAAPDPRLQRDALGEIGNVVTGNVLPLVYGAMPVFRLDAPTDAGAEPFAPRGSEVLLALSRLTMDEGDAVVALFAEPDAVALLESSPVTAGVA